MVARRPICPPSAPRTWPRRPPLPLGIDRNPELPSTWPGVCMPSTGRLSHERGALQGPPTRRGHGCSRGGCPLWERVVSVANRPRERAQGSHRPSDHGAGTARHFTGLKTRPTPLLPPAPSDETKSEETPGGSSPSGCVNRAGGARFKRLPAQATRASQRRRDGLPTSVSTGIVCVLKCS